MLFYKKSIFAFLQKNGFLHNRS